MRLRLVLLLLTVAVPAAAHVKWFSDFSYTDRPLPLSEAVTPTFVGLALAAALAMGLLVLVDRRLEKTAWHRAVDGWLSQRRHQGGPILRAGMAAVLLLSWQADALLAPELGLPAAWVGWVEFLVAVLLLFPRSVPHAGALILALYVYGVEVFGLWHMLDYLHYAGAGYYFLVSRKGPALRASGLPALYSSVGISLCWLAMEKVVYPGWGLYVLEQNPQLALGFDLDFFLLGSAFVEMSLGYLLIICLLQRPIALLVTLVFFSTTLIFGKLEVIGHTQIHAALILFLLEGPGERFRAPYTFHTRLPLRVAFASVNFLLVLALAATSYAAAAQSTWERLTAASAAGSAVVVHSTAPSVSFQVRQEQGHRVLVMEVTNFRFARGSTHVPGEGHAHLLVDGRKEARLYGPVHDLSMLTPGPHRIEVSLQTNDHRPYATPEGPVRAVQRVHLQALPTMEGMLSRQP